MRGFVLGSSLPATVWPFVGLGFGARHLEAGVLNWLLIGLFFPALFGLTNAVTVSLPGRKTWAQMLGIGAVMGLVSASTGTFILNIPEIVYGLHGNSRYLRGMNESRIMILTGLAGALGAVLVGAGEFMLHFDPLVRYGQGFDFFKGVSESQATTGHFFGVLGGPLYLVGAWHFYLMPIALNVAFFIVFSVSTMIVARSKPGVSH